MVKVDRLLRQVLPNPDEPVLVKRGQESLDTEEEDTVLDVVDDRVDLTGRDRVGLRKLFDGLLRGLDGRFVEADLSGGK